MNSKILKSLSFFVAGIATICVLGAVATQSDSLYILNPASDEIPIRVRSDASKTTPFLELVRGGISVYSINSNGVPTYYDVSAVRTSLGLDTIATNSVGITTNVSVFNGATTNTFYFTNGILKAVVAQ